MIPRMSEDVTYDKLLCENEYTIFKERDKRYEEFMELSNNFMERFWKLVDEKAFCEDPIQLHVYMYNHRDGHVFVQARNDYHMFQQLHNAGKLKIGDADLFAIIQDFFEDYSTDDLTKIVDYILLNCGHWSDLSYTKIEYMTDYKHF